MLHFFLSCLHYLLSLIKVPYPTLSKAEITGGVHCPALRCPAQGQMGVKNNKHPQATIRREPRPVGQQAQSLNGFGRMAAAAPLITDHWYQASFCFHKRGASLPLSARITGFEWSNESGKHCVILPQTMLPHTTSPAANVDLSPQHLISP